MAEWRYIRLNDRSGRPASFQACLLVLVAIVLSAMPIQALGKAEAAQGVYCDSSWVGEPQPRAVCVTLERYNQDLCGALQLYAEAWGLPVGFFARLIWQESRFDPNAVSPAGAQGIAQFMPSTGRMRGLRNPYNPAEALARSAEYLRFLSDKYGNLGLAAAAYNSGEGRTSRFLSRGGYMPLETERYVQIITGLTLGNWLAGPPMDVDFSLAPEKEFAEACLDLAKTRTINRFELEPGPYQPWGVQVGASFQPHIAEQIFDRVHRRHGSIIRNERPMIVARRNSNFGTALRYHVMVGSPTKKKAEALCAELRRAGGSCIVVRN